MLNQVFPKPKPRPKVRLLPRLKLRPKPRPKVRQKPKAVQRPKPRLQLALNNVLLSDTTTQRLANVVSGKSSLGDFKCLNLEIRQPLRLICMKLQINASLDCLHMICPRQMRKSGACKDFKILENTFFDQVQKHFGIIHCFTFTTRHLCMVEQIKKPL